MRFCLHRNKSICYCGRSCVGSYCCVGGGGRGLYRIWSNGGSGLHGYLTAILYGRRFSTYYYSGGSKRLQGVQYFFSLFFFKNSLRIPGSAPT